MSIVLPSKKEWDENKPEFPPLPEGIYTVQVVKVEETDQKKYMSEDIETVMKITLEVLSTADGGQVVDVNGEKVSKKLFFVDVKQFEDQESGEMTWSLGFTQDGVPSKARQLVCYILGFDPFERVEFEDFQQLLGKKVQAMIIQKVSPKTNKKGNKVDRFISSDAKAPKKAPEMTEDGIPIIEEDEDEKSQDIPF